MAWVVSRCRFLDRSEVRKVSLSQLRGKVVVANCLHHALNFARLASNPAVLQALRHSRDPVLPTVSFGPVHDTGGDGCQPVMPTDLAFSRVAGRCRTGLSAVRRARVLERRSLDHSPHTVIINRDGVRLPTSREPVHRDPAGRCHRGRSQDQRQRKIATGCINGSALRAAPGPSDRGESGVRARATPAPRLSARARSALVLRRSTPLPWLDPA